jgi:hypothetical protein
MGYKKLKTEVKGEGNLERPVNNTNGYIYIQEEVKVITVLIES